MTGRGAASQVFDNFERLLRALAGRHPAGALRAVAALGRGRNRLSRRWPPAAAVLQLLPDLTPRRAAQVARAVAGLAACNRLLAEATRRGGLEPLRPLLRPVPEAFLGLRPPLILGIFHAGLMEALGPALERLGAPVLVLRHGHLRADMPPLELVTTEGDEQRRAAAFLRAFSHLKRGGFVAAALDVVPVSGGIGLPVSFLGRRLELARGPFALARLTGSPILPLVARRRGGGAEVVIGEPLAAARRVGEQEAAARERALAGSVAAWFESYLRDSPEEIGLGLLRNLVAAPRLAPLAVAAGASGGRPAGSSARAARRGGAHADKVPPQ